MPNNNWSMMQGEVVPTEPVSHGRVCEMPGWKGHKDERIIGSEASGGRKLQDLINAFWVEGEYEDSPPW